ncbi:MAG TPA: hypothetical protein VF195_06930 [Actinomycetota bacterium]
MTDQILLAGSRRGIPEGDVSVLATGRQDRAVRREQHRLDGAVMGAFHLHELAGVEVQDRDRAVPAAEREQRAVGSEGLACPPRTLDHDVAQERSGPHVSDPHPLPVIEGEQPVPIQHPRALALDPDGRSRELAAPEGEETDRAPRDPDHLLAVG